MKERLILLAAGHGYALDGMVKCLLKHPVTGMTFLDHILSAFNGHKVTVVVGYRAVEIMELYPYLDYVYNPDWATTNNSYSLGLALNNEPCYVCSSDMLIDPAHIAELSKAEANLASIHYNENRALTSINCILDTQGRLLDTYVGPLRKPSDPEAFGMFKISDQQLLLQWKRNCLNHANLFVGQTLPLSKDLPPIWGFKKAEHQFIHEINTPLDYLTLLKHFKKG